MVFFFFFLRNSSCYRVCSFSRLHRPVIKRGRIVALYYECLTKKKRPSIVARSTQSAGSPEKRSATTASSARASHAHGPCGWSSVRAFKESERVSLRTGEALWPGVLRSLLQWTEDACGGAHDGQLWALRHRRFFKYIINIVIIIIIESLTLKK